jgi:predicted TIM-barrel fold metal-dependent hydrolase
MNASSGPIDVNVFLGAYPFRKVPGTTPQAVLAAMDRVGIARAWVTHLPSLFWKDPAEGNDWLYQVCIDQDRFTPVPSLHPELANWREVLDQAQMHRAAAIRCDPQFLGINPAGKPMLDVVTAAGDAGIPLMMAVRLEDARQRHPADAAGDLAPSAVRAMIRHHPGVRLVVTHADRGFIEEVHFGSSPQEAGRIWWDICWIWGPPEDHLQTLVHTVGAERFLFGTGMPLRLPENAPAKLDLSELSASERTAIERGNATAIGQGR